MIADIITCQSCAFEISPINIDPNTQFVICPSCKALFKIKRDGDSLVRFKPSMRSLPAKMSVKVVDDELIIAHHSRDVLRIGLLGITSFLLIFGLFFSELPTPMFLFNPLTWFVIGLGYYALSGVVNKTVVHVNPDRVIVKSGPLPPWQNRRIDVRQITQLYVKQHIQRSNKGSTTTYKVYLTDRAERQEELVSGLEKPEQALFLEQEIERFLGIEDQAMPTEHASALTYDFSGWGIFAETNGLHYTPAKLLEGYRVYGNYRGYKIELMAVQLRLNPTAETLLSFTVPEGVAREQESKDHLSSSHVTKLFTEFFPPHATWIGKFKSEDQGAQFIYEQKKG